MLILKKSALQRIKENKDMSYSKKQKKFVIALGGSIICPKEIDIGFLSNFYTFLKKELKKEKKFIIMTGGGSVARQYQAAASKITKVLDEDKDWLGIHATRINAHLLRTIFQKEAHPIVFDSRFKLKSFGKHSLLIASGWEPGCSTDFDAVQIAVDLKIKEVIILGKPAYVYTGDPQKDKNAEPIRKLSWKNYLKMVPKKWVPGLHSPVDPLAARLAQKKDIKVIVADKDLNNFKKILEGDKFKGTIIY